MIFSTLDQIIRKTLLEKSMPIHLYAEYMYHGASCLRQLSTDTLKLINTANLPIDSYGAIDLPQDFVDDIGVALPFGGLLQPIPKRNSLTPIRIHDATTGAFVPYSTNNINTTNATTNTIYGFNPGAFWFWNINDWSEPTGRYFGANGGATNGYKVIKERRQIQLIGLPQTTNVILQYVSGGQSIDNATQIDTLAIDAIQKYIIWQTSESAGIDMSPQGAAYYNQRRVLRARLNDITLTDIVNVLRSNYTAAGKQ